MSKTTKEKNQKKSKQTTAASSWKFPYNKQDMIGLLIGVIVVAVGYLLMATGISNEPSHENGTWNNFFAVDLAPIVLFIGYVVIIPMALFKFFSRSRFFNKKSNDAPVNE